MFTYNENFYIGQLTSLAAIASSRGDKQVCNHIYQIVVFASSREATRIREIINFTPLPMVDYEPEQRKLLSLYNPYVVQMVFDGFCRLADFEPLPEVKAPDAESYLRTLHNRAAVAGAYRLAVALSMPAVIVRKLELLWDTYNTLCGRIHDLLQAEGIEDADTIRDAVDSIIEPLA